LHVTDTDFDLDDEPVLTAEGEVAAANCGHQVVMRRGDALTADMLDEFHAFVQEELAALLEEKNAEIAYLRAIVNGKFADAAQMRLRRQSSMRLCVLGRVLINRGSYASSTLVRYRAYCRLKPDIASGPRTAKWRHARASAPNSARTRLGVRSDDALHFAVAAQSSFP
jgi:hypothetical protein